MATMLSVVDGQMEKLEELLPGIEEFLCQDLAGETLTEETENKRLYYLERLDILKLPPSIPPRLRVPEFGAPVNLPSPIKCESPPDDVIRSPTHSINLDFEDKDFAAYQREISRSLIAQNVEAADDDSRKEVKVYDDIDTGQHDGSNLNDNVSKNSDDTDLYEIPVIKTSTATTPTSPTHNSSGYEETSSPKKDAKFNPEADTEVVPPPLPPRRERTSSECPSRGSIGSLLEEKIPEKPPDLPLRPNLPSKQEIYSMTEKGDRNSENKSEHSIDLTGELTDDVGLTSYESCDEEEQEIQTKQNFKLPKPAKKTKKTKKSSRSRSSKEWDVTTPYNCLEEVTLSGELQYKGKLSWTRKLAALTEGRMVCYKPEKTDSKPSLVLQLTGYEASICEASSRKDMKKGFDIRLIHPSLETHMFSSDFKDWAQMWCEYINAMALGKPPPGQYHFLARTTTFSNLDSSRIYGSKSELRKSTSNVSSTSSNEPDMEYSSLKRRSKSLFHLLRIGDSEERSKVARMGSIAHRATQFFENIGKKKDKLRPTMSVPTSCSLGNLQEQSLDKTTESLYASNIHPSTPKFDLELPTVDGSTVGSDERIQHQGHLNIFSSFNKRKWGKRWCIVRENKFECYRNQHSKVCELDFFLRECVLKRAVSETKSELGIMLTEAGKEKITVEPLTVHQMSGWLRVFMNETITEKLPEGLGEFWVEDESPYHIIRPEEVHSPTSDGYHKVLETSPLSAPDSPYDFSDDCAFEETNTTNSTLINQSNSADCSRESTAAEVTEILDNRVKGEVTGDLYTQVQRRNSSCSSNRSTSQSPSVDSMGTFTSTLHSQTVSKINGNILVQSTHSSKTIKESQTLNNTMFTYSQTFSSKFEGGNHGDLFSEIISKINDNFRSSLSDEPVDEETSDLNTDTAYNSACGSENSSLERKGRNEVETSNLDQDSFSQTTDYQISPLEENNHVISADILNSNLDQSNSNLNDNVNQLNCDIHVEPSTDVSLNNSLNQKDSLTIQSTVIDTNSANKPTREQCDSAIFESESILDDVKEGREALLRKISQLRTHLVELKKNRIHLRDRKVEASMEDDISNLESEYGRLDDECRTVSEEIAILEKQLLVTVP